MDLRELKALEIAARSRITWNGEAWMVPSQSGPGRYAVTLTPKASCTCDDFSLRTLPCKHVIAARLVWERDHGGKAPKIDTTETPKKKTYKQNWPAYNLAQTTEKDRLQVLLFDLCERIEEPVQTRGRPRTPLADIVFACAFKVYSTFSSRRFACDLNDAHAKGYLTKPMHSNKCNTHLENPALTPLLKSLITRTSLPLKAIETSFAPDSSGFSTSRFVKWFDEKYGKERSGREWVKAHIMTGVRTNVVTAIEILDKNANDCPQFAPLVKATAENFTVKEVTADKAYLSHENLELVEGLGGEAFIPYKSNSKDDEAGGVWSKMFHYFQFRREEFLSHYHQRSNVESTFSMVKAKFRDDVRNRTDSGMVNEVLCKFLCHNICCVIMAQCELGIEPVFWQDEAVEPPTILSMQRPG
jgi:transposase